MIIRHWNYQARADATERFEEFEKTIGIPTIRRQAGCQGIEFFRRQTTEQTHNAPTVEYLMISHWESWELLQAALVSTEYQEEISLFLEQNFGEAGNGTIKHFEVL